MKSPKKLVGLEAKKWAGLELVLEVMVELEEMVGLELELELELEMLLG